MPRHILFVHGVGDATPSDFSAKAERRIAAAREPRTTYGQAVHWGPVLDRYQSRMAAAVRKRGSTMRPIQSLSARIVADALSYQLHRDEIFDVFDRAFLRLRADEVSFVAHSLGCLLSVEYLLSRPKVKVHRFVTMGCNLQLWWQGRESAFPVPPQLRAPGVWHNVVYPSDGLGWPVGHWLPATDHLLRKPFWSVSTVVRGLSHNDYWHDSRLFGKVLPDILG